MERPSRSFFSKGLFAATIARKTKADKLIL